MSIWHKYLKWEEKSEYRCCISHCCFLTCIWCIFLFMFSLNFTPYVFVCEDDALISLWLFWMVISYHYSGPVTNKTQLQIVDLDHTFVFSISQLVGPCWKILGGNAKLPKGTSILLRLWSGSDWFCCFESHFYFCIMVIWHLRTNNILNLCPV